MFSALPLLALLSSGQPTAFARSLSVSDTDSGQMQPPGELAVSAAGPQRTVMQCLGTQTLTRACHFENVYYDLNSSRFVHYGIDGATADVFGDDQRPGDPWLRLIRYATARLHCENISAEWSLLSCWLGVLEGQSVASASRAHS